MRVGLPRALLFYRYRYLWETFFKELGCEVIVSEETDKDLLKQGISQSVDENCLPLKVFMGHVKALQGRCDRILVPRFERVGKEEEYCVRFWGLPDLVQNTFLEQKILSYDVNCRNLKGQRRAFIKMGRELGIGAVYAARAYRSGMLTQQMMDMIQQKKQLSLLKQGGTNILIAAQPYVIHDRFIGEPVKKMVEQLGGTPIYSDYFDPQQCRHASKEVSSSLYWTMNKEMIGAIAAYKHAVDGIILLTAFPCGTDSLVNELVMRRVKDVPLLLLLVDEQQAQAGLETRLESFMDVVAAGKKKEAVAHVG